MKVIHILVCFIVGAPSALTSTVKHPSPVNTSPKVSESEETKALIASLSNDIIHSTAETLSKVIRGDVASYISADLYGQTLAQESAACPPSSTLMNLDLALMNSLENDVSGRKLYGGAQYHRTIQLFHKIIETFPIDDSTADEIALLLNGMSSTHDGSDLLRSVAILSSRKISIMMEDVLNEMAKRIEYIFLRMWDLVEYSLVTRGSHQTCGRDSAIFAGSNLDAFGALDSNTRTKSKKMNGKKEEITHDMIQFIRQIFENFVREKVSLAFYMARDDMSALFRYVSWDLAFGDKVMSQNGSLSKSIGNEGPKSYVHDFDYDEDEDNTSNSESQIRQYSTSAPVLDFNTDHILNEVVSAIKSIDHTAAGQALGQTCAAVNVLVQHVTCRWRKDVTQIVCSKFNTFCLLSFHHDFMAYVRRELEAKYRL